MPAAAPSPDYETALDASKALHALGKKFNGRFLFRYMQDIKPIIDELGCKTLLDYGCGRGIQWTTPVPGDEAGRLLAEVLGVKVTQYDPACPPFATEPRGKFDIVVCTQVLGSIPVADHAWVVDRLYRFARKAVYVGERLGPVRKRDFDHIVDKMPRNWTHAQWADVLKRGGGTVQGWLRTRNGATKERILEQVAG